MDEPAKYDAIIVGTGQDGKPLADDHGAVTHRLTADRIFLNVGARPRIPPVDGLDDVGCPTSASLMELDRAPDHLLVLGGGFVGLEFAQMFRRFGSEVTIVEKGPRIAGREDPDVSEALTGILEDDGITVRTGAEGRRSARMAWRGGRSHAGHRGQDGDGLAPCPLAHRPRPPAGSDRLSPGRGCVTVCDGTVSVHSRPRRCPWPQTSTSPSGSMIPTPRTTWATR